MRNDNIYKIIGTEGVPVGACGLDDMWKPGAEVAFADGELVSLREYVTACISAKQLPGDEIPDVGVFDKHDSNMSAKKVKDDILTGFCDFCDEYNVDTARAWRLADQYLNQADPDADGPADAPLAISNWDDCIKQATRNALTGHHYGLDQLTAMIGRGTNEHAAEAEKLKAVIMSAARDIARNESSVRDKGEKIRPLGFTMSALAEIIIATGDVRYIEKTDDSMLAHLAIYHYAGPNAGTWTICKEAAPRELATMADVFLGKVNSRAMEDLFSTLANLLQRSGLTIKPLATHKSWFAAVADGIVDYRKDIGSADYCKHTVDGLPNPEYTRRFKVLYFTDKAKFTSQAYGIFHRAPVQYDPAAADEDVKIVADDGHVWSAAEQISATFGGSKDQERIFMGWAGRAARGEGGKTAMFLKDNSETSGGGGGKSTLAQMMKNALGEGFFTDSLAKMFNGQFGLAGIENSRGVVSLDNNDTEIQDTAAMKLLFSNETIKVTYKHKTGFDFTPDFPILIVSNYCPRFSSKDSAVYRRLTVLECPAEFTRKGKERQEIIDDYVKRPAVARYFLARAIKTAGTSTCISKEDKALLAGNLTRLKASVSSVYTFWENVAATGVANTEMPIEYYHEVYRAYAKNAGMDRPAGLAGFTTATIDWINDHPGQFQIADYSEQGGMEYKGGGSYSVDVFLARWRSDGPIGRWIEPRLTLNEYTREKSPYPFYNVWIKDARATLASNVDMAAYYMYIGEMVALNGRDVELLDVTEFCRRGGAAAYAAASWDDSRLVKGGFEVEPGEGAGDLVGGRNCCSLYYPAKFFPKELPAEGEAEGA